MADEWERLPVKEGTAERVRQIRRELSARQESDYTLDKTIRELIKSYE